MDVEDKLAETRESRAPPASGHPEDSCERCGKPMPNGCKGIFSFEKQCLLNSKHAPPPAQPANVADGWALTKLRDHEAACEACGRAVWDGKDEAHCIGFLAPCGRRVARLLDCGTVDCIKAVAAAPQPAKDR